MMRRGAAAILWLLPALLGTAQPAEAELTVRVGSPLIYQYESVSLTVVDSEQGQDADPGPVEVTMADARDRRTVVYAAPTDRPGEWRGRFTPTLAGRLTGAAVLARGEAREIGLVPLIQVRRARRPGFLSLKPDGGRAFHQAPATPGAAGPSGSLFPLGIVLAAPTALPGPGSWDPAAECERCRALGANLVVVPLPDDAAHAGSPAGDAVDRLLLTAEQPGRSPLAIILRLRVDGPTEAVATRMRDAGRRWGWAVALAAWQVQTAGDSAAVDWGAATAALRSGDAYGHAIGAPAAVAGASDVGDFCYGTGFPTGTRARPAMAEATAGSPLESLWQWMAVGGLGAPVLSLEALPEHADKLIRAFRELAVRAGFHAREAQAGGGLSPSEPAHRRFGSNLIAWTAGKSDLALPAPRGRYAASFLSPQTHEYRALPPATSTGGQVLISGLPGGKPGILLLTLQRRSQRVPTNRGQRACR